MGLSNTLDADFCMSALVEEAIRLYGRPEIFNTDQGSQFTSHVFTKILEDNDIRISMDGRSNFRDNIFIERLWWTVKYQYLYLHAFNDGAELRQGPQGLVPLLQTRNTFINTWMTKPRMRYTIISNYNRLPDVLYENKTDSQLIPMLRLSKQLGSTPRILGMYSQYKDAELLLKKIAKILVNLLRRDRRNETDKKVHQSDGKW